ncbi:MAG: hypothetical protein KME50_22045 [Nostoc desertorum CM1-VF14]|nr:hypothetical protein [Nostoc desertorum CM1-VF14]
MSNAKTQNKNLAAIVGSIRFGFTPNLLRGMSFFIRRGCACERSLQGSNAIAIRCI